MAAFGNEPQAYKPFDFSLGYDKEGRVNESVTSGQKPILAIGRTAQALGVKPGTLLQWNTMDPEKQAAFTQIAHQLDRESDTEKRKKLQKTIKIIAATAIAGGAIAAAGGAAAAGGGAASGGGTGAAATGAGTAGATGAGTAGATGAVGSLAPASSIAPIAGTSAAGGAVSIPALSAGAGTGAGTAGITGATISQGAGGLGSLGWKGYAKLGLEGLSAYQAAAEQKKMAEDAGKAKTSMGYRTPYGNEYISPLIQWILQQQQSIFESRMRAYGGQTTNFDVYRQILQGISPQYSGVGMPGAPIMNRG